MNKKTKAPLNEIIYLGEGKYDVSGLRYRNRICYFEEKNCIVIKANYLQARIDSSLHEIGEFVELSKSEAATRFPGKFINSAIGGLYDKNKAYTVAIKMSASEILFCRKHGAAATYVRELIRKEMIKENFKADEL